MRTTTVAATATLLLNVIRGAATGYTYFWLLVVGPANPISTYASLLFLTTVISFITMYPAPFVFFAWLGYTTVDLERSLGMIVTVLLACSFAGYGIGFAGTVLAYSTPISLVTSLNVDGTLQFFFVAFGALAIAYLWKSKRDNQRRARFLAEAQ